MIKQTTWILIYENVILLLKGFNLTENQIK